jgi:hypothetical protein
VRAINQREHAEVSRDLEEASSTHSTADAHGNDDMTHAKALASEQGMTDQTLAAHAIRMTYGNGTAIDVKPIIGNTEFVATVENLYRKCFVEFPQTDILDLQTRTCQQFRHREDRADTHLIGLTASHCEPSEYAERLGTDTLRLSGAHDHARARSIGKLARVACGDRTT